MFSMLLEYVQKTYRPNAVEGSFGASTSLGGLGALNIAVHVGLTIK